MSVFDKNDSGRMVKFGRRFDVAVIKVKVIVFMMIKRRIDVELERIDLGIIDELKKWSMQKGYSLEIKERDYPIYFSGHHLLHQTSATQHRTILIFSR